jgi:hypothetical protein
MSPFSLIILSSLVAMAVGMLWYSPFLFGRVWAKLRGLHFHSREEFRAYQKSMFPQYVGAFIATIAIAWTLWALTGLMGIVKIPGALLLSTILWAGLIVPSTFSTALYDKKNLKLWAIDIGCAYASMLAIVITLYALK